MDKSLPIEICIGNLNNDFFNHWGYYDNPDEAIEALLWIKEHMSEMMEDKE